MVSDKKLWISNLKTEVLILVLMEYGLWPCSYPWLSGSQYVLILVLMEYGLWPGSGLPQPSVARGLNPCSNGIWSLTHAAMFIIADLHSLNPCSNGIWSLTWLKKFTRGSGSVVLILVLMEYGLWHLATPAILGNLVCLNPCSNGIWSLT